MMIVSMSAVVLTLSVVSASAWLFDNDQQNYQVTFDTVNRDEGKSADEAISCARLGENVQFEMKLSDDRFQLEATIGRQMSALDECHHLVIAELEGSCSELSEEDVAKLSVRLFNCQSLAEHRPTYHCTTDMTIAECTADMDPVTWNAYQIVSNRARAVCFSVRQQSFQRKAESTVNRLLASSQQQLAQLQTIHRGQEQIQEIADRTVESVESGHKRLARNQEQLDTINTQIHRNVIGNLHHIRREKELIVSSHHEILKAAGNIREKLDKTMEQLADQSNLQKTFQQQVIEDIAEVEQRVDKVSTTLGKSVAAVESFHHEMIDYHYGTLDSLRQINATVNYLMTVSAELRQYVDRRLQWLLDLTGNISGNVDAASVVIFHGTYLILLVCLFAVVRLVFRVRCLLVGVVVLNAVADVRWQHSLKFYQLAAALTAIVFVDYLLLQTIYGFKKPRECKTVNAAICYSKRTPDRVSNGDMQYIVKMLESIKGQMSTPRTSMSGQIVPNATVDDARQTSFAGCSPPPIARHLTFKNSSPTARTSVARNDDVTEHVAYDASTPRLDSLLQSTARRLNLLDSLETVRQQQSMTGNSRQGSPSSSCASTPSKRRTGLNRSLSRNLCEALTKCGQQCKLPAQDGSLFCHRHQQQLSRDPDL